MAAPSESSYLWTTGGAGDGASTYTTADLSNVWKITGCVHGDEGVGDYGNHYDATGCSGGEETVTIDTGAAIVDGKPHMCSVAGDITVPAAVGAGNTRIDRIVLRADWTAQTVRLTRIAGTDAASPTAPSVTTTSGTTYDVLLYRVTVNTDGDVTVSTDERAWAAAQLAGTGLATNTSGGIDISANAIDDTLVGNRVPQLYRRQGGSATDWNTQGTTDYTPTTIRMQCGTVKTAAGSGASTITFPVAFSAKPIVIATAVSSSFYSVGVQSISTTQVVVVTEDPELDVHWLAIGPE